jgi:hypothetical protein
MAISLHAILKRRWIIPLILIAFFVTHPTCVRLLGWTGPDQSPRLPQPPPLDGKFQWANFPLRYPVAPASMIALPTPTPHSIPKIQHNFPVENAAARKIRLKRLGLVKSNFTHAWNGYKQHAWMSDEVMPLSGGSQNPFGGWAATLVDALGLSSCLIVFASTLFRLTRGRYPVDYGFVRRVQASG